MGIARAQIGIASLLAIGLAVEVALAANVAKDSSAVTDADRQHWAFLHSRRPPVPATNSGAPVNTPIDAFLLRALEAQHLSFSPPADRQTLLRRAYLDLHGLPPSPEETAAFLNDRRPNAFARWVDRLLASPQFGQRWAPHWLDVVGYADTVGFDTDANNIIISDGKWRYRDYVIDAFNADKPYDSFLTEQIAGDELVDWRHAATFTPAIRESLIATGYLRTARDQTHEPESNIPLNYYGVLHDTVEVLGSSIFALTLNCARCHSHKFDPLPQQDYYRMMALLTPAYNPKHWKPVFPWKPEIVDRALPDCSPAEKSQIDRQNAAIDRDVSRMRQAMARPGCRPEERASLARKIAARAAQRRHVGHIQALYDVGPPPEDFLLRRGQFETPGARVDPGFLSVLCDSDSESLAHPQAHGADSGRRLALARWITREGSRAAALASRVMVNRVWQHLFGEGLVRTADNLGAQGEPPSHPELLEWLAAEFQTTAGWRIKPLVRLMLLSAAYQQSSQRTSSTFAAKKDPAIVDPDNRLLWRMRPKRLEGEVIRDCVLAVSGQLDSAMAGPPVLLVARPDGLVVVDHSKLKRPQDANRRSVYLLTRRAYNLSLLTVFDRPLFAVNCPKRDVSVIPLQSLSMLNDAFVADQAEQFARRIWDAGTAVPEVQTAFKLALGRSPTLRELNRCRGFLSKQESAYQAAGLAASESKRKAAAQLCQTLFNTSEFLYAE